MSVLVIIALVSYNSVRLAHHLVSVTTLFFDDCWLPTVKYFDTYTRYVYYPHVCLYIIPMFVSEASR